MRLIAVAALLGAAFTLAACGGGDGSGGESAEKEIAVTLEKVLEDPDPVDCRTLQTKRFLEQTKRNTGETSLEACEHYAREDSSDSIEVSDVSVDGSSARAKVTYVDGAIGGASLLVGLVADDDGWKVDEVVRYLDFDKEKVIDAIETSVALSSDETEPNLATCVSSQLARVPEKKFEESLIQAAKLEALVREAGRACGR